MRQLRVEKLSEERYHVCWSTVSMPEWVKDPVSLKNMLDRCRVATGDYTHENTMVWGVYEHTMSEAKQIVCMFLALKYLKSDYLLLADSMNGREFHTAGATYSFHPSIRTSLLPPSKIGSRFTVPKSYLKPEVFN